MGEVKGEGKELLINSSGISVDSLVESAKCKTMEEEEKEGEEASLDEQEEGREEEDDRGNDEQGKEEEDEEQIDKEERGRCAGERGTGGGRLEKNSASPAD